MNKPNHEGTPVCSVVLFAYDLHHSEVNYESNCLCVETKLQVHKIGERGALQNAREKERWTAKGYGCKEHGKRNLPLAFSLPPTPHLFQLTYWLVRCEDVLASSSTSASNRLCDFG